MKNKNMTPSRWEATAKFHESMAAIFEQQGRAADAKTAHEAAVKCRKNAKACK